MKNKPDKNVIEFLSEYDEYLIIGHREPDGDCIGSQLGLSLFLERKGKKTRLFSPGPFMRPEISDKVSDFHTEWTEPETDNTAVIIVDCSTIDRIGRFAENAVKYPILVIDHHSSGRDFGDIRFIDSEYPAVTLMIYSLIKEMNETPSEKEAEVLYFGFCTDTGFYRHLEESSAPYMKMSSELIEYGASPKKAFHEMYGHRSFESRKLIGIVLSRLESHAGGQIVSTYLTKKDRLDNNNDHLESDIAFQLMQAIKGAEVIILIREEDEQGQLTAGLRSLHSVDVGKVAAEFDGGGHARASGFSMTGDIGTAKRKIIGKITPLL